MLSESWKVKRYETLLNIILESWSMVICLQRNEAKQNL